MSVKGSPSTRSSWSTYLIKPGDTVVIDGDLKTVGKKDITTGGGMGTRLFGDSYGLGTKKVQRVVFGHSASGKK